jgi:hypothetical protein
MNAITTCQIIATSVLACTAFLSAEEMPPRTSTPAGKAQGRFLSGQSSQTRPSAPPARPIRTLQKRTLAGHRSVVANELKVTLKESAARSLSLGDNGKPRAVDRTALMMLDRDIKGIEGRHTCSRRWLDGEEIPAHLRMADGSIPRIARNFTAILRPDADVVAVRAALQRHPQVERVDFKPISDLHSVPNDTSYGLQWAPPVIGLETAWDVPGRGHIRVAVIDTGVRLSHPEFAGRIVFDNGYADFGGGDAPASGAGFDHGTHVAGIVCATRNNGQGVAGYSNDIDLMVLNCATWDDGESKWKIGNADDAIDDAVANGARVINCSFEFGDSYETEVNSALSARVLVVHAAGNSTNSIAGLWESSSIALFTITATMPSGSPATDVFDASYSNFGPGVDLAAPGSQIYSTVPGGYVDKWGTSMAAPQVSGAAALLMSLNPDLMDDMAARHLLIRMAEDKGAPGYDQQYGWGVLRLRQATLQACRDATAFVSSVDILFDENGHYVSPWHSLPAALGNVPNGSVLVLNGGDVDAPTYHYPAITITNPCTLTAIPDRLVIIGR